MLFVSKGQKQLSAAVLQVDPFEAWIGVSPQQGVSAYIDAGRDRQNMFLTKSD
jgi:hypothetical protein